MSNKVSWIFLAQDQYSAVAAKIAQSTQSVRDKFAGMSAAASKAADDMNTLTARAKKAGEGMISVGKSVSMYVSAPAALFAGAAVRAYDQEAKALAQVEAAIISTGSAAKLNIGELVAEASRLEGKTVFGDDTILKDVTSRLLSFTNITGDTFKRTQEMALDLSTALGKDLGSSALLLGKALDDPVQGLSALSRVGVRMDPAVEEYVKVLWTAGKKAEAQQLVLNVVAKKFGGRADAAARAGLGPLQQLGNAYNNFQENVGKALLNIFLPLINTLKDITLWLNTLSPETAEYVAIVALFLAALGPIIIGLGVLASLLPILSAGVAMLGAAWLFMTGPVGIVIDGVAAMLYLFNKFGSLSPGWQAAAIATGAAITIMTGPLGVIVMAISAVILALKLLWDNWDAVVGKIQAAWDFVTGASAEINGEINSSATSRTAINVNLRAPQGAVDSVKSRTSGNVPGMNVGINMVPAL